MNESAYPGIADGDGAAGYAGHGGPKGALGRRDVHRAGILAAREHRSGCVTGFGHGQGNGNGNGNGQGQDQRPPEIVPHRTNPPDAGAPTAASGGLITPTISDHHGPAMGMSTPYLIWYGNWNQANGSDTAASQQIVRDFS